MTRTSFLDVAKQTKSSVLDLPVIQRSPVMAPMIMEPVIKREFEVTAEDISKLGSNAAAPLEGITRQILNSVKASGDDPISNHVNGIVKTLKGLNPDEVGKGNFLSKIFGKARNLIEDLKAQLSTAEQQMDVMSKEVHKGIQVSKKRKQELEVMLEQNNQYGLNLDREYQVGLHYLEQLNLKLESQTQEGLAEDAAKTQKLVDSCEFELAEIKAYRLVAANNVPKIEGMIMSVENLMKAGTNVLEKMMPVYMVNYAQYIISLESKNSALTLNQVNDSFNQGLVEGSNLAHENLIETSKLQNRQSISIESMRVMHENMLKGLDELDKIAQEGRTSRIAYVSELQNMEKDLANKISKQTGA